MEDRTLLVVRHIYGNRVSIGIVADRDVTVHRREVWDALHPAAAEGGEATP
jgi:sRNA-binding carbon storage regulator CsrA